MHITFEPLAESHFPLLLKWLTTPHVKAWWDKDIHWTADLIQEKYNSYVKGFKLQERVPKKIDAYIICADTTPVGYIYIMPIIFQEVCH